MISSKLTITGEDCHRKGLQALRNGNDKKAFDYFSQGYGKFHGPCLTELGKMYENGHYVEMDKEKAMFFFKRGAYNYGELSCNFLVGELYCRENRDQLSPEEMKVLSYIDSVELKSSEPSLAQYNQQWLIGEMFRLGLGHEKSFIRALYWYNRAIDSYESQILANPKLVKISYKSAYLSIGYIYEEGGFGEEQSYPLALKFYKDAADEHCAEACNKLGNFYKNGYGLPIDYKEAFRWYFKAAAGDNRDVEPCTAGQFNLGIMYRNGLGTKVDNDSAMFWFKKATYGGNREAGDYVEQIHRHNITESRKKFFLNQENQMLLTGIPENHESRLKELEKHARITEEKIDLLLTQFERIDTSVQVAQKKQIECNQ